MHNENTETNTEKFNPLKETIESEVQRLAAISREYITKIREAKTSTKVDYYKKKLKKNNNELAQWIITLEKYRKIEKTKKQPEE